MAMAISCRILLLILSPVLTIDLCPTSVCRCMTSDMTSSKRLLDCENLQLSSVPPIRPSTEIFAGASLRGNSIKRLDGYKFSSFRTESLDLTKNPLEYVDKMAFYGLQPYLKRLSLQGNKTVHVQVPFYSFETLPSLEELHLQDFFLGGMDRSRNFQCLPSLRTLRLVEVDITYLTSRAFENNPRITTLQIASCMTNASLPVSAISKLTDLENLYLTDNGIRFLPRRGFYKLKNLTLLDLSGNPIHGYENQCFEGSSLSLEYLILSNTNAPRIFFLLLYKWKRLRHLDISRNKIQGIPSGIFSNMPFLTSLDLSFNKMTDLPFTFPHSTSESLKRLQSLDLSGNSIHHVDTLFFANLRKLYTVNLSKMLLPVNFTNFNTDFKVNSLPWKDLILSGTNIHEDEFWMFLHLLKDLETLRMDNTGVSHVDPEGFIHNKFVRHLSLRDNEISNLKSDAFTGLETSLEFLDLRGNRLFTVSECTFTSLKSLQHLQLAENPLRCDCHLQWLQELQVKHLKSKSTETGPVIDDVICKSPVSVRNRKLRNLADMTSCSHKEGCRNNMAASSNDPAISKQHFYITIVMLATLVVSFVIIFGIVLVRLKFKKPRAERALRAIYKAESRKKTDANRE